MQLNSKQFPSAPLKRLSAGGTMTLEEYKALAARGEEPHTDSIADPAHVADYQFSPKHTESSAGKAETRREAKRALGLNPNDSHYGED